MLPAQRVTLVILLVFIFRPAPLHADCDCPDPFELDRQGGILWRGRIPLTLAEIAQVSAPILWFTPEEPLLYTGSLGLPDPHPCDPEPSESGTVYYQAHVIRLKSEYRPVVEPLESDRQFFDKVNSLLLRYFFYYREDVGMDGHEHDLEVAEFHLLTERTPDGCYQLRLTRVVGFAHGVDWYNNILDVKSDTRLPVRLLVEEAKHATCPDRNGDGVYTPGYDVNVNVNDAWGVRDVLGSGSLLGSSFQAAMAKPRSPRYRDAPPDFAGRCPSLPVSVDELPIERRYTLRSGAAIEACDAPHAERLSQMMQRNGMGKDQSPKQYEANSFEDLTDPFRKHTSIIPGISYRYDGLTYSGWSVLLRGANLGIVWVVPKFNVQSKSISGEVLFTPSASRWADWYLTLGPEFLREVTREENGEDVVVRDSEWEPALELGAKFRFRTVGKLRYLFLGYGFGGIRMGLRTNGLDTIEDSRFVFEFGAGVW